MLTWLAWLFIAVIVLGAGMLLVAGLVDAALGDD